MANGHIVLGGVRGNPRILVQLCDTVQCKKTTSAYVRHLNASARPGDALQRRSCLTAACYRILIAGCRTKSGSQTSSLASLAKIHI